MMRHSDRGAHREFRRNCELRPAGLQLALPLELEIDELSLMRTKHNKQH
jgi:hypothetical protein